MQEHPPLNGPPSYPTVRLLQRYGRAMAVGAGAVVFAVALGASAERGPGSVLRSLGLGALAALAVKNLSEINAIVAETLLPQ